MTGPLIAQPPSKALCSMLFLALQILFLKDAPHKTVPVSGPPNPGGPKAHPSPESFLIFSASGTLSQGGGPGPWPLSHSTPSWFPHTHLDLKSSSGSCQHPCRTPPVAHTHGSLLLQGFSGPQNFPVGLALNHTPPRPPAFWAASWGTSLLGLWAVQPLPSRAQPPAPPTSAVVPSPSPKLRGRPVGQKADLP